MRKLLTFILLFPIYLYAGTAYHYQCTIFDSKLQRAISDPNPVNVTIGKNNKVFTFIDNSEHSDRITTNVVNITSLINSYGESSSNYVATDEDGNELRVTLISSKPNTFSIIIVQSLTKLTIYQLLK